MKEIFDFKRQTKLLSRLFFAILIIFPLTAFAEGIAELNFIGFSKDGKYAAFEEYGAMYSDAGPTDSFSKYFILNVEKNVYAVNPVRISIETENDAVVSKARTRARLKAAPLLKKFGIVPNNHGRLLVSRMLTDNAYQEVGEDGKSGKIDFTTEIVLGMGYMPGHDFELTLNTFSGKENSPCGNYSFRIEMLLKDKTKNTEKYLQKDSDVPKDRDCPLAYGVQYIYLYKNSLIVFLNTYIQGFETRNAQYMAVTGKVNLD